MKKYKNNKSIIFDMFLSIVIIVAISCFGIIQLRETYSVSESYTITFHQAWGQDGDPYYESQSLPISCSTKYGESYFNSCVDSVGLCRSWSPQKNGGGYGHPIEEYSLSDLHYDYIVNNVKSSKDYYCVAGSSGIPHYPTPTPPDLLDIKGVKVWDDFDNQDGIRPKSVTIELYDGISKDPVAVTTATEDSNWTYEFKDLPELVDGVKAKYVVKEQPVLGYTTTIDNYKIINHHVINLLDIKGVKVWDDFDNQDGIRPKSVTIELYNGISKDPVAVTTATEDSNWTYEFKDLPELVDGVKAKYVVKEQPVLGYTTMIDNYKIINHHVPEDNPKTGGIAIFIAWVVTIATLFYSVVCFKKVKM